MARGIVDFATSQGIAGATVLEIGGGVGQLHIELLRRGASHVTNLEISENYEAEAARLLEQAGMTDRVTRHLLDVAQAPDDVEPADVVVLHRVVCCYPDYARLLSVAAGHARKTLVYSHPAANVVNRVQFGGENIYRGSHAMTSGRSSTPRTAWSAPRNPTAWPWLTGAIAGTGTSSGWHADEILPIPRDQPGAVRAVHVTTAFRVGVIDRLSRRRVAPPGQRCRCARHPRRIAGP